MDSITKRYAPMHRLRILAFPNLLPCIDWKTYFPNFIDPEGNDTTLHLIRFHMNICLIRFHMNICNLKVDFHEMLLSHANFRKKL
jgi:hypothetical protein